LDKRRDSVLENCISYTTVEEQWESYSALNVDKLVISLLRKWPLNVFGTPTRRALLCLHPFSIVHTLLKTDCSIHQACQHISQKQAEVNLSSTLSHERLTCISLMLALRVHLRASRASLFRAAIFLVKVDQCCIMDRLLPILATVVSMCFDHDSLNPGLLHYEM
jgi:hypothetical protein